MKKLYFLYIFIFFLLISCTTFQFGKMDFTDEDEDKKQLIREFDLGYSYKIMGIPVKGEKSIVESTFKHPDNTTVFFCISFPKIGILRTDDNGMTFKPQFFKLSYLEKVFGYENDNNDESNKNELEFEKPIRFFNHFAVSPTDENKIVITFGPYIFLSTDKGLKWNTKNIFYNMENTNINDIFINKKEEIIIVSDNKICISKDWGKKWEKKAIKIGKEQSYKIEYITGLYDLSSDIIYASIKYQNETDSFLSQKSYEYFYKKENFNLISGVYYSKDFGNTWQKSKISVPAVLWEYASKIYACPIYPIGFYVFAFNDDFKKSEIYKEAKLNVYSKQANEFVQILQNLEADDIQILSLKNNMIACINNIESDISIFKETDFKNLYRGIEKIQYLSKIQWNDNWYNQRKSNNFCFEYNLWKIFKLWTGMMTNDPILYTKRNNIYYRIKPTKAFLKAFIKYSISKQIELNNINPFLKKKTDKEFFDPKIDPTNGFPVEIEYSQNEGKTWQTLYSDNNIKNIIDPLGNKRSGFFWYKNIDQKKIFKMQISFGFDQGVNFNEYPIEIQIIGDDLVLKLNYFSVSKSYKDLYLFPITIKN